MSGVDANPSRAAASTAARDAQAFLETQQQTWDAAAEGWRRWWHVLEAGAQPLNEHLADRARLAAGQRVLDIATGSGEPALTAARRVLPTGRVVAVDLSPRMLALASERAREQGLAQIAFRQADAENLAPALGAERFDAALCRWGLMLLRDPGAACRGALAALEPGGVFVAAVWAEAHEAPFFGLPIEVAQRVLGTPRPAEGTPGALALGRPGSLEALFRGAGFVEVEAERWPVTLAFDSAGEHVGFLQDISSTLRNALAEQPPEVHARVWAAVAEADARHTEAGGRVVFRNVVHCVRGRRPASMV